LKPALRRGLERVALILFGVVFEMLAQPPGPAPLLVFVQDVPFLLLLWHAGGVAWKRWAYLYAFVKFAVGLHWLSAVHVGMPFGAAAVLASLYLRWGASIKFLVRRGMPFLLTVGVTAVLEEMGQTVVQGASGMPWPARSLAFTAWEGMTGAACVLGAYGLSALAATTSAWASGLVSLRVRDEFRVERMRRLIGTGFVLAVLITGAYVRGSIRVSSVDARLQSGDAFSTAPLVLIQPNIAQSLKNHRGETASAAQILEIQENLTKAALLDMADHRQSPLAVVWPETMIPYHFVAPEIARRFPEAWESQYNVIGHLAGTVPSGMSARFLVGANYLIEGRTGRHDEYPDHDSMDSYFFVDPSLWPESMPPAGDAPWLVEPGRHDKATLVPWGEYTPGGSWCPPLERLRGAISIIPELTAGTGDEAPFVLAIAPPRRAGFANREVKAGTIICFEIAFPSRCRAWRGRGAGVLINPANYAWYGDSEMPSQVMALGKLRAAELNVAVVIAGNSGPTAILDPAGRLTAEVREGGRTQFVAGSCRGPLVIDPDYETSYAVVGDVPWVAAGALLLALALLRGRRAPGPILPPAEPAVGAPM
jgi:apolipoprotein N-acyltransferase